MLFEGHKRPTLNHTVFCDNRVDKRRWRNVESRIKDVYALWRDVASMYFAQLIRRAFFNHNVVTSFALQVERARGGCNHKWNLVVCAGNGKIIGSNLVRDIAISCDPVGADDDGIDSPSLHDKRSHVIRD